MKLSCLMATESASSLTALSFDSWFGGVLRPARPSRPTALPLTPLFSRLALLTLTSNGFGNSADTGAGLALALLVVSSNTAYTASAYNVTGFTSYLFVPYHDVLEGTQSVLAFVCLVVITSLFHVTLVTAMSLSMFYTMGLGGPPLMLPTFAVGVFLWVLGVFGFITLIMGLETLFNSCCTGRIMHTDEITARRHQLPVSPPFPFLTPSLLRCRPMSSLSACCSSLLLSW